MKRFSRVMGVLMEITQKYVDSKLVETEIVIRTEVNNWFHFLGLVPNNLLGRLVDVEQVITREDKQYYYVRQEITDLEPVQFQSDKHRFVSSSIPEKLDCHYFIKAHGKLEKT